MTDDGFVEVLIEQKSGGHMPRVADWLRTHGLHPIPMKAGLLVTGDRSSFRQALGVDLDPTTGASRAIPIPPAIKNDVASIWLTRARDIRHSR